MRINIYKLFFSFSFFRFKERYITFKKALKFCKRKKNLLLVFLHPNIKNDLIKQNFEKYWKSFFKSNNLENVHWLIRDEFESWWKNVKNENSNKGNKKITLIIFTDKHYGSREYRTALLSNSNSYLVKDLYNYVDSKYSNKKNIFNNIYTI